MDGSNSNKRKVEAQREEENSTKRQTVTMGLETLDCSVCSQPLRPQIFQCSVGHFICSSCLRLVDAKCRLCSAKTSFKRCFGMEHVVQSVTVSCTNAKHGCTEKMVYYQKEKHEKVCLNAPCFCPETGCSFAGQKEKLLNHFAQQHQIPITAFGNSNVANVSLDLQPGIHVLECIEGSQIFLFKMTPEPFGHAISVICVQPRATEPKFTCDMYYESYEADDFLSSCCKIRCSSLSDGLPTGYDLIVPKGRDNSDQENCITLIVTIRGERKVFYDSDSDGLPSRHSKGDRLIPDHSDSEDDLPSSAHKLTVEDFFYFLKDDC